MQLIVIYIYFNRLAALIITLFIMNDGITINPDSDRADALLLDCRSSV